jgi:hypothetical protein
MQRTLTSHLRLLTVAVACLAIGAGASAIATAGAAPATGAAQAGRLHRALRLRTLARRTVAGSLVVATKSGFVTVTIARGRVQSVNGNRLTLVEGTPKRDYRTVTLTFPAHLRVRNNRHPATLAQLTAGERATVLIAPHRALVVAHTPQNG